MEKRGRKGGFDIEDSLAGMAAGFDEDVGGGRIDEGLRLKAGGGDEEGGCGRGEAERDCVFCEIVAGTRECAVVYENERVVAILDRQPVARGHCLVLLRRHRATMDDMEPAEAKVVFEAVQLVARAVIRALKAEGFNIGMNNGRAAGQTVGHVHVHVIPRHHGDEFWCTRRPQTIPVGAPKTARELQDDAHLIEEEVKRLLSKRLSKL